MEIHSDASGNDIGTVLIQMLAYASRLRSAPKKNYSTSEKECLALVWAVQRFRHFSWGMEIRRVTDHHSRCYLLKRRDLTGRLACWSLSLQDLDGEIVHRSGRLHTDADVLSRNPVGKPEEEQEIPASNLMSTSSQSLSEQQQSDLFCKQIFAILKEGPRTSKEALQTRLYHIQEGVLYRESSQFGDLDFTEKLF